MVDPKEPAAPPKAESVAVELDNEMLAALRTFAGSNPVRLSIVATAERVEESWVIRGERVELQRLVNAITQALVDDEEAEEQEALDAVAWAIEDALGF